MDNKQRNLEAKKVFLGTGILVIVYILGVALILCILYWVAKAIERLVIRFRQ